MEVNGTALKSLVLFVKKSFGDEGFSKWLNSLSGEAKSILSSQILSSNWYNLKTFLDEPTRAICTLFYDGKTEGAVDAGRYSAEEGLKGIYKFFVKLGSAKFLFEKASTILPTYYRPSKMEPLVGPRPPTVYGTVSRGGTSGKGDGAADMAPGTLPFKILLPFRVTMKMSS